MTLRLELLVPGAPLRRANPAPVTVTLINAGSSPVLVDRRMAPGYVDSDSPADFAPLAAGARISTEIDLLGWYRLRVAGAYRVVAHYRCDEEWVDPPAGTFVGVVDSAPVTIVVE